MHMKGIRERILIFFLLKRINWWNSTAVFCLSTFFYFFDKFNATLHSETWLLKMILRKLAKARANLIELR